MSKITALTYFLFFSFLFFSFLFYKISFEFKAELILENTEEATNPESTKLQEYLEKVEGLFSKVRHPREAVHDSSLLVTLTKKGRQQAQQLKTDLVSFDNHTFIEKIVSLPKSFNIILTLFIVYSVSGLFYNV